MSPYHIPDWANFFSAAMSASAALAGFVIVAISVNIQQILKYSQLPIRAGAAIADLILVLVSSTAALIPQPVFLLGCEVLVLGTIVWLIEFASARKAVVEGGKSQRPRRESVIKVVSGQLQTLPFIVGGLLLFTNHNSGLYWMAAGVISVFIFSVMNVWVLLVEILR